MNGERHKENPRRPFRPIVIRTLLALMGLTVLSNHLRMALTAPTERKATTVSLSSDPGVNDPAAPSRNERDLREENRKIKETVRQLAPKGVYATVDTAQNRLWIKKGEEVVFEAVVSTGSGATLTDPENPGRRWRFETPRGEFRVQAKPRKPVWIKPDWAFIEEGISPFLDRSDRVKAGMLRDDAIFMGNGYFIHGTLYTRLLGTDVTAGLHPHGRSRPGTRLQDLADRGSHFYFLKQQIPAGKKSPPKHDCRIRKGFRGQEELSGGREDTFACARGCYDPFLGCPKGVR